jgi:hypothetical protein
LWGSPKRIAILTEFAVVLINGHFLLITDSKLAVFEETPDGARGFDL